MTDPACWVKQTKTHENGVLKQSFDPDVIRGVCDVSEQRSKQKGMKWPQPRNTNLTLQKPCNNSQQLALSARKHTARDLT